MIRNHPSGYPLPFVGRTRELAEIATRLQDPACRLLTLTGLGGSGKTRLALEAAQRVAALFPDGAVFVGLQPVARSDSLVPAIGQAVGLPFFGQSEVQDQLLDYLRDRGLLLILDNFEHLRDAAGLVNTILVQAPQVKVLATSREALSLREEWLYPVKGLPSPPSVYAYVGSLEEYEAAQLFLYHARRVQPGFDPAQEHEAIVQICHLTAGLPLALELAASWLKAASATQIARNMQGSLTFLSTTLRDMEERHRSMHVVFDQTWELLSANERRIFARLSVFRGGFASEAAARVAGGSFADLAALVEKALVQLVATDRYGVHELLRQYGKEKLEEYAETAATYDRHSDYFAQQVLQHETALRQPQQLATLQVIERDFENIRLAWDWAVRKGQWTNLHAMLNGLYLFGNVRGRYRETIALFQETLQQHIADRLLRGRLLARRWGYLQWWYPTDYQETLTSIQEALGIARADNNRFEVAFCELMTAYVRISMQRYGDALAHLDTSRKLFQEIDEPYYVCWVLHRLGFAHFNLNQIGEATTYNEQSLALAGTTHNKVALVVCLYNLGSIYILSGDYIKGQYYSVEALQAATELGHQAQISYALSVLALCALCQSDARLCEEHALQAYKMMADINLLDFQHYPLALLILLACQREDYAEGVRLKELGKLEHSNTFGRQLFYWALATLACGLDQPAEARRYVQEELDLCGSEGNGSAVTVWIAPSAVYALAESSPETAVELLSWVVHYPDTALEWARRWPLLDRVRARLEQALPDAVYRRHWEKGQELTLSDVPGRIRQALRTTPDARNPADQPQLLTAREVEILRLLAAGLTNPQIAEHLVIGAGTVKTHTLNIYRKLDVANRTQAIARAQELGLLRP